MVKWNTDPFHHRGIATMPTTIRPVSVTTVVLSSPGRRIDLQVRVTARVAGAELAVLDFAHGYPQSSGGYDTLFDAGASRLTTAWLRTALFRDVTWATPAADLGGLERDDTKAA